MVYAGQDNLWQFTARDGYGNIRIDNDTIVVHMEQLLTLSGKHDANITWDTMWNATCECYDVPFRTEHSMRSASDTPMTRPTSYHGTTSESEET